MCLQRSSGGRATARGTGFSGRDLSAALSAISVVALGFAFAPGLNVVALAVSAVAAIAATAIDCTSADPVGCARGVATLAFGRVWEGYSIAGRIGPRNAGSGADGE